VKLDYHEQVFGLPNDDKYLISNDLPQVKKDSDVRFKVKY
jgi:hypothetical protein